MSSSFLRDSPRVVVVLYIRCVASRKNVIKFLPADTSTATFLFAQFLSTCFWFSRMALKSIDAFHCSCGVVVVVVVVVLLVVVSFDDAAFVHIVRSRPVENVFPCAR